MTSAEWRDVRLRFVADVNPSVSLDGLSRDTEVTFLPLECVWPGERLDTSRRRFVQDVASGFTRFLEGDVLVPKITPTFEAGRSVIAQGLLGDRPGFGTTELHILRPGRKIDPRFLWYRTLARDFLVAGEASMVGVAGQQRVPTEFVKNFTFGVPSLEEQRRIADYLDREALRAERLLTRYRSLSELSTERELAGIDEQIRTGRSSMTRLKFALTRIEQGWSPQCEPRPATRDGWGVLKVGSVNYGVFRPQQNKALPASEEPRPHLEVRSGDLLMSRANTRELVGSVALVREAPERLLLCDKLYRLIPDGTVAAPEFLELALRSSPVREQLERATSGASGSMQNISHELVRNLRVPLPSLDIQTSIVRAINAFRRVHRELFDRSARQQVLLDERRKALITGAVTGQVDPTHTEPAATA